MSTPDENEQKIPPPPPPKMWFVSYGPDEVLGPLTTAQLREAIERHEIHFQNSASTSPQGPWVAIHRIPEFAHSIASDAA